MPKRNKRPLSGGCLGVIGIFVFLCMGCGAFSAIQGIFSSRPGPTQDANAIHTIIAGTALASNQATLSVPSPTTVIENTSSPLPIDTQVILPTSTDTQAPFFIAATGGSCIPNNPPETGRVDDVVDGDTIKVIIDRDGLTYSVRYIGIDTPENTSQNEYYGPEATAKNAELVAGKTVNLIKDVSETDRYGRLLRYVLTDSVFVNYELVAQGYANTATYPPDVACIPTFQSAEQQATALSLGFWAVPATLVVVATSVPSGGGSSGNGPCNCGGSDLDCGDFVPRSSAQTCYNYCQSTGYGDVFRLDRDNDGLACES